MKFRRTPSREAAWALALLLAACGQASAGNIRLTVFHTNDIHGWFMSRPDPKRGGRVIGGMAAAAKAIARHREPGQPSLLVDAGDWFQGTPEGTLTQGRAMAELFNALAYDAIAVGNHEYDLGEGALKDLVARIKTPVLGANVKSLAGRKRVDYLSPWVIREAGGIKVGIFGLLSSKMGILQFAKNIAGLEFEDEVAAARRAVAELKAAGAEIIILLSHVGREDDRLKFSPNEVQIASEVPGIDLIVGGHTHSAIPEPRPVGPHGVLLVNTGSYLSSLGRVVLEFDPLTRKMVAGRGELLELWTDDYGEDERILEIGKRYQSEVGGQLSVVLATATQGLSKNYDGEGALGDWMTDCARKWTKTELAFHNARGVRSDLARGPVLLRHFYEIMPFDNYVVTLNMTGAAVRAVLEHGVSGKSRGIVQLSGARFEYDAKAPPGARVRGAWVGGRELEPGRIYSVSAPDFMVDGGDGYAGFALGTDKAATPSLVRDILVWCAREYSPIAPPPLDRIAEK